MTHSRTAPGLFAGVATAAILCAPSASWAAGFMLRSHSAKGFGSAAAGVAAGDELSYSYWNPAALAGVEGVEIEAVGNGVFPSFDIAPSDTTNAIVSSLGGTPTSETDIAKSAFVPASYMGFRVDDKVAVGVSMTAPFGLATEAPDNWAGQVYSRRSEIFSLNVNPMASYEFSDQLTIGIGVMIQYFEAELTQAGALAPGAPSAALTGDDIALGLNVGMQFALSETTTIGLGYRSSISHELDGELDVVAQVFPAMVELNTPDLISFGLRQEVGPQMRLLGTVEWANWSRIDTLDVVHADLGAPLTALPLNYRDGWLFAVGGEYDLSPTMTARAGYGYEIAPLTDETRDTRLPEVDQHILSAGLSWTMNARFSFDFAYTHAFGMEDGPISIMPGDPNFVGLPFEADSELGVGIVSSSVTVTL